MIFHEEATEHLKALNKAGWRRRVERIVHLKTPRGPKRVRVTYALIHADKEVEEPKPREPKDRRLRLVRG